MITQTPEMERRRHFRNIQSLYKLRFALKGPEKDKRTLPWPDGVERGRLWCQRTIDALQAGQRRLPHRPRGLDVKKVNMNLFGEYRIVKWSMAQEAYNQHMHNSIYEPVKPDSIHESSPEEQWVLDQKDPDNWAVVPEFDVMPDTVGFEGFRYPILRPGSPNRQMAESMRSMLRVARSKVRTTLPSKRLMLEKVFEVISSDGAASSTAHRAAIYCHLIEQSIVRATDSSRSLESRAESFSDAVSDFVALVSDDQSMVAKALARRDKERNGGILSAEMRQGNAVDKGALVQKAEQLGWPKKRWGINKAVAAMFNISPDYAGEILKERLSFRKT
jgi:hypothetical protein